MPIYSYKALDKNKKIVSAKVEADSEGQAVETLKEKKLKIISLQEQSFNLNMSLVNLLSRIKPKDIVIFSRQFSVLVSANVALVQSLKLLSGQTENRKFAGMIMEIANEVDGGARLSDSLAKRGEVFSKFYINVVKSGETSGKLDDVLNYLADELEKDYDMTGKIKGAMIYPVFVFCGLGVVGIIMMVFVVPKLTTMMRETGGELPVATKILIAVSDFLVAYWIIVVASLIGAFFGLRAFVKNPVGKKLFDTLLLKLPVFGNLFQKIYLVRFTRSLNTLIIGGVSISRGLAIVAEVVNNEVYKKLIEDTLKEVEDGNSISTAFVESKEVPSMVSQMMMIGEKTGKLDTILERITDFYTREVNNIIANLMTLMEPVIMVILGIGVGLMVAAIILPMYQMSANM